MDAKYAVQLVIDCNSSKVHEKSKRDVHAMREGRYA